MYTVRITLTPDPLQFDLSRIVARSDDGALIIARARLIPWCGLDTSRRCRADIIRTQPIQDC